MQGLLVDVNVQGHLRYLIYALEAFDLKRLFDDLRLRFATFGDLGLAPEMEDRDLWEYCQREGWLLLTGNRNAIGPGSLQRTLDDSWSVGCLPVLTISNVSAFENDREYEDRVAGDVADVIFGSSQTGECRDRPRIYVPMSGH